MFCLLVRFQSWNHSYVLFSLPSCYSASFCISLLGFFFQATEVLVKHSVIRVVSVVAFCWETSGMLLICAVSGTFGLNQLKETCFTFKVPLIHHYALYLPSLCILNFSTTSHCDLEEKSTKNILHSKPSTIHCVSSSSATPLPGPWSCSSPPTRTAEAPST